MPQMWIRGGTPKNPRTPPKHYCYVLPPLNHLKVLKAENVIEEVSCLLRNYKGYGLILVH